MSFDFKSYNARFLAEGTPVLAGEQPGNDPLARYGVRVIEANVTPGETYWKVVGVHHLKPGENRGRNHIYLEALNAEGVRLSEPIHWSEHHVGSIREPVLLEKPASEPIGNIPISDPNKHSVLMRGSSINSADKSDIVANLHTDHPDEPQPGDGLGGNTRFHHSFYIVFQRTRKGNEDGVGQRVDFLQHALMHGLGNALTAKFTLQEYQVQAFERGVVFARLDTPNALRHQLW